MEKYFLEKIKTILEQEEDITDITLFYNISGNYVLTYMYNNEKYLIDIENLGE